MWRRVAADLVAGLRRGRSGVTALEYALIASALAFVIVAVFAALGTTLGQAIAAAAAGL